MPFDFQKTPLANLLTITPKKFGDARGFFVETYKKSEFAEVGITEEFVQDNHSCSAKGVLRGIHFQREPRAQGKLIRVTRGSVWDVAVDLRRDSLTFGKWFGLVLSEENGLMMYIPKGFGHGFITLEDDTHFMYKCTDVYSPEHEGGIIWNDPTIAIEWPQIENILVSEKDKRLPLFTEAVL